VSHRSYNFSAGPATLPETVIKTAQLALWDYEDSGVGIMEHSHRGPLLTKVFDDVDENIRALANVSDDYEILFLQGGASSQFFMLPMNLLGSDDTADYINTGAWSKKAMVEARKFGKVHEVASSADKDFTYIPDAASYDWSPEPVYAHFTSNNTIAGTQFATEPTVPEGVPLVCDASSDIFSRPTDFSKYAMVYAGAQKNLGPSGVTLVIMRKELVERGPDTLPTMLQYRTHANKGSRFNTPPTFGVFIIGEVIKWLRSLGGLRAIAEHNRDKAKILYDFLDESAFFSATARDDSRSLMNVCFCAAKPELEESFVELATEQGFIGLKGHRSVGGMRASIYNAFPREGVVKLVEFMKEFERSNR